MASEPLNKIDPERNRFTSRLGRTAKVGVNLSGAALSMGANHLFSGDQRDERAARALAEALGKTKGPLMKIAQMLSTIPDLLPPEYADKLATLQAGAPAMGWPFVKRRMRAELGSDWQDKFSEFSEKAAHAASLGQVHKATLPDGRILACKLQYADMASAVESDVNQLKNLLGLFNRFEKSIDATELVEEITERLREELDYEREAKAMRLYRHMHQDRDFITCPEPIEALSTRRLLTMTWHEGARLESFETADQATRNHIATLLFWAWWGPMNSYGVIHGDPHLGNYQITEGGKGINLLDFGCIRIFPAKFVGGVVALYKALRADDKEAAFEAYKIWGFENLTSDLVDILNIWAKFIYGPILQDRVRTIADGVKPGEYGRKEAFQMRQLLKEKGPVKIPREFVFMDRAAIGLGAAYLRLGAELNFHHIFEESLENFSVEALEARQKSALERAGLDI